ncbi:MAG: dihydrolipoamide succinyltransferase, partial [Gammaproteobacteria bacterium]
MSIEVKVPVLPESVSDATIANWRKKVGEAVARDENLVDLETDKVVLEVPSPVDGVLKEIRFDTGATVTSEQVIAVIEQGAAAPAPAKAEAPKAAPAAPAKAAAPAAAAPAPSQLPPGAAFAAAVNQVNPAEVAGTGRRGAVTKEDIVNHVRN